MIPSFISAHGTILHLSSVPRQGRPIAISEFMTPGTSAA